MSADHQAMGTVAPITLGTAGHVDHGKTALVAALTGVDTDRLPEEKARGLTIALGYAPLVLPSGRQLSLIDVPGHARFVRTMVSGATGVDLYLMVVASDDGVMPQTVEHADVLRALGVEQGVIAITKADIADPEPASKGAAALLPGMPLVPCSARTGAGLSELRSTLELAAARVVSRASEPHSTRLHVDRAFTIIGRGTVVTGTLWSGAIALGDTLELLPRRVILRVRGIEVHGTSTEYAAAGQRVAVNIVGVRAGEVARGDVVASPGHFGEMLILDCALDVRAAPTRGERVQVLHGTRCVTARAVPLESSLWQLRLERPLVASVGDRFVVRRLAPPQTLGGGVVLEVGTTGRGRSEVEGRAKGAEARDPRSATTALPRLPEIPPPASQLDLDDLERRLLDAGPALISEAEIDSTEALRTLRRTGVAVRISGRLYGHATVVADVRERVVRLIEGSGPLTLAHARDVLGISRKQAHAFLEHLDGERVTRRMSDDTRVLLPRARRQLVQKDE